MAHPGGRNGDKDGYVIPVGTDIFISVSLESYRLPLLTFETVTNWILILKD